MGTSQHQHEPGIGAELLGVLRAAAAESRASGSLPSFLADLERVRAEAILGGAPGASVAALGPDRLLTADELARRLGKSRWWVYRQARTPDAFPFRKDLPGGRYGFSERGLERFLAQKTR